MTHIRVNDLSTEYTLGVIRAVPEDQPSLWDRAPGGRAATLRVQLAHLALVRESIARTLAGEGHGDLAAIYEAPPWTEGGGGSGALAQAFLAHAERTRRLLARIREEDLRQPFTTYFGNASTPENYLRLMLLEETHHRAQMVLLLRLWGIEPPPFPGERWAGLGL